MKSFKIALFLCTILFISLSFKNKITEGDVHKMLQSDFKMEAKFCGCFGCGNYKATIYKKTGKRWLKLTPDDSGEDHKTITFEFSEEIEKRIESYLINRIKNPDQHSCTTSTEYTFKNKEFRFRIFDGGCSLGTYFSELALLHK